MRDDDERRQRELAELERKNRELEEQLNKRNAPNPFCQDEENLFINKKQDLDMRSELNQDPYSIRPGYGSSRFSNFSTQEVVDYGHKGRLTIKMLFFIMESRLFLFLEIVKFYS